MSVLDRLLQFNSSRHRLLEENTSFAQTMLPNSMVLDAGCGDAPYKHLFTDMRYETADFAQSDRPYAEQITYVCDLKSIPAKNNRFDYIVFNQVLEHIPEPQAVLDELYRVLKPGGKMICTAPLMYHEHEQPYDFHRYTQFGWKHLLEKSGFTIERLDWLEGFFGLCGYYMETIYYNLPRKKRDIKGKTGSVAAPALAILHPFIGLCAVLFHRLEKHTKIQAGPSPKNYVVIVAKPSKKNKQRHQRRIP